MKAPTAIVSSRSPKRIVQRVFVYNGNRRVKSTINGVTTPFIGNYFEWHTDANDKVRYYYAGGQRIAMRTGNNVPTSNLTYLFGDHPSTTLRKFLGSTSLTYKADTGATTTQLYSPWGRTKSAIDVTTF